MVSSLHFVFTSLLKRPVRFRENKRHALVFEGLGSLKKILEGGEDLAQLVEIGRQASLEVT